jgi:Sulfatase
MVEANKGRSRGRLGSFLAALMSLVPTPLLIFISSANKLYLRNQAQLDYRPQVLLPFLELFAVTLAVGALLYLLSGHSFFRYSLWAYYLVGPFYLAFKFLHGVTGQLPQVSWLTYTEPGAWLFLVLFAAMVMAWGRWVSPRTVVGPLAAFGVLLLLGEVWQMRDAVQRAVARPPAQPPMSKTLTPDRALPNVYHIMLDGFQTDMFSTALSPELEEALGGFTYFPDNTSIYHLTSVSLASMFSSRRYAYDKPKPEYMDEAVNGKSSLIYRLNELGYITTAYLPALQDTTRIEIADYIVRQADHARYSLMEMNSASFRKLWIYSQVPRRLRAWFWAEDGEGDPESSDLKRMEEGRFLPYSGPVVSALSFSRLLEEEPGLPERGRYTFVHLLMPHPPYMLRGDCSHDETGAETDRVRQTQCAIRLLLEFLEVLHRLHRFDGSLIVVHADHGGEYRLKDNVLVHARSRSLRALLLIKPVGARKQDGFRVSSAPSTVLDIAPTVLDCLGAAPSEGMEGKSLLAEAPCGAREQATSSAPEP